MYAWAVTTIMLIFGFTSVQLWAYGTLAYLALTIVYLFVGMIPYVKQYRGPNNFILSFLAFVDWWRRVLVHPITRFAVAFFLILVLVSDSPSLKVLFLALIIGILVAPQLTHKEKPIVEFHPEIESVAGHEESNLFDDKINTYWQSKTNQKDSWWVELNYDRNRYLRGIKLDYGDYANERPNG